MSLSRILLVLAKDLRLGPRSPIFLWVLVLPVLITLMLQVTFGDLLDPSPRLGIVDEGSSEVTTLLEATEGLDISMVADAAELRAAVEANRFDAGLVLPEGFDDAVRSGTRPSLELYVAGESLAANRTMLAVTTLDFIREVDGGPPLVDVIVTPFGQEALPMSVRLVPLVVMYALLVAAVFLPAFSLADEREKRTLSALVVSPVKLSEVVMAKGIMGFVLAIAMALVTLWLNDALGAQPFALTVVLLVAAAMLVEVGLVYGTASKDITGVFTLIKGTAFILLAPTVFYIFPNWPQWIAKLFPTYWVISPVYEVTVDGAGLGEVWVDLVIAIGVMGLLAVPVVMLTRRLITKLALS